MDLVVSLTEAPDGGSKLVYSCHGPSPRANQLACAAYGRALDAQGFTAPPP